MELLQKCPAQRYEVHHFHRLPSTTIMPAHLITKAAGYVFYLIINNVILMEATAVLMCIQIIVHALGMVSSLHLDFQEIMTTTWTLLGLFNFLLGNSLRLYSSALMLNQGKIYILIDFMKKLLFH